MIIYDICAHGIKQTMETASLFVKNYLLSKINTTDSSSGKPIIIYLTGTLGAGKTTFMRGLITGFGFKGSVKSPTYTIVEPYLSLDIPIYHFDLYRLEKSEELELIGIRDYLQQFSICCFEWPDKGTGHIPTPDFIVELSIPNDHSRLICISEENV